MATTRTQAQRDAMTVEIGYALFSAAFAAAVVFGTVYGPALLFDLPGTVDKVLLASGLFLAALLFPLRVVTVLVRFGRESAARPSHPGRTNPDS
ncbi:DUF6332 family protein [Streptomyces sp. NPDC048275]|uniref:DUF6332 family protein n=1 Tax=Streptomyces sp. NPDC048275 TaxID=3155629 RepID=UPI00340A62D2